MLRLLLQAFTILLLSFCLVSCTPLKLKKEETQDKDELFSDPSANTAVFKHYGDMTIIEPPKRNDSIDEARSKRNAVRWTGALWPNGRIPYIIESIFSPREREVILGAMRHWEDNTCIRFFPRTNEQDYIRIFSGGGCFSFAGRVHSFHQPQGVSLGPGCVTRRVIAHELGHVIGFYHEQNRPDRGQHVNIINSNIKDGKQWIFRKFNEGQTNTLGYGYDYASIMHYHSNTFTKDGHNPTITATDEGIVFGSAQELSPLDILKQTNFEGSHPPISTFPKSERPLALPDGITCGSVVEGTSGTLRSPGYPNHVQNQRCAWVIRIPAGYNMRLRFPNLNLEQSTGCTKDYVQVFRGQSIHPADGINMRLRFPNLNLEQSNGCTKDYVQVFRGQSIRPADGKSLSRKSQDGKFCRSSQIYTCNYINDRTVTILYQTDGNNVGTTPRGLQIKYQAIDINECSRRNRCHRCTNLLGSYRCDCNDGYYHSAAANTCYDVNECAYDNGGCEHQCDNTGGSYRCLCNSGFFLQSDGLSCGRDRPVQPPPTNTTTVPPTPPPNNCPVQVNSQADHFGCGFVQPGTHFGPGNFRTESRITSPLLSCQWVALGAKRVRIKYFDVPGDESCSDNYVAVYGGFGRQSPQIGEKMCGVQEQCNEIVVETEDGRASIMTVDLVVTQVGNFKGIYAEFEA